MNILLLHIYKDYIYADILSSEPDLKWMNAGVDVILDSMGASYFQRNLDSLNIDGRLFIIGTQGGAKTELDIRSLFAKRLTVQGMAVAFRLCCVLVL